MAVFFLAVVDLFVVRLTLGCGGFENGSTAMLNIFFGDSSLRRELAYSFSLMLVFDPLAERLLLPDFGRELVLRILVIRALLVSL